MRSANYRLMHACFVEEKKAGVTAIIDLDIGGKSITNDAEGVVASLHKDGHARPGTVIVYRDSAGQWDELGHDGAGKFTGFKPIGVDNMGAAILVAHARAETP